MVELATGWGFTELNEGNQWHAEPGDKVIIRRDGSIIFVVLGSEPLADHGLRLIGAHTDSPTYKIRPHAMRETGGMQLLNVEP
ncbi:hypothetical protein ACWXBD_20860, partial [Pseudoalteromonas sp. SYSU M81241]